MFRYVVSALKDMFYLIYPNQCLLCESHLVTNEYCICTVCEATLPYTHFHTMAQNPVEKKLWGRVPIIQAASLLYFEKGLAVQHLISQLKYKNRQDVGEKLGEIYGKKLNESLSFNTIDVIIPIPLHPKKLQKRGYNQCHLFALKLGEKLQKSCDFESVIRTVNTITQTGKNRINRWENVSQIFEIKNAAALKGKHVLIVDDVITTGATIEALALKICEVEGTKISVLVMASAL